jgi:hypothetical protein
MNPGSMRWSGHSKPLTRCSLEMIHKFSPSKALQKAQSFSFTSGGISYSDAQGDMFKLLLNVGGKNISVDVSTSKVQSHQNLPLKPSGRFLSGVVAVPVYPPSPLNLKGDMFKLDHIARDSGSKAALTTGLYKNVVRISKLRGVKWPVKEWFTTDEGKVRRHI